jgi:hypothetical protein
MNRQNIKEYFGQNKIVTIGWKLNLSTPDEIEKNFEEEYGEYPNEADWNVIDDSIRDFEDYYADLLSDFGNNVQSHGYQFIDYDNSLYDPSILVGSMNVTMEELCKIIKLGDYVHNNGEVVLSGKELDPEIYNILHDSVDVIPTFLLPQDLCEKIFV